MAAADSEEGVALERVCHVCEESVESEVWFARTDADEEQPRRVYACPDCYFDLPDDERETYYRERV